jgi:hypothetical protein
MPKLYREIYTSVSRIVVILNLKKFSTSENSGKIYYELLLLFSYKEPMAVSPCEKNASGGLPNTMHRFSPGAPISCISTLAMQGNSSELI